jgi:flagellar basal-body rod protein FlgF
MDRLLYLSMSGARQALVAQGVTSHNLANANTTGFRADFEQFRSMPVFGEGFPSRAYAMQERPGFDFKGGSIQHTGNPLDIAIKNEGWLAVQAPDGSEAYTRAGDLRVGASGLLETARGELVLGNGGPIALPPAESLEIASDGTISIRPVGQEATALVTLDRLRLVNPPLENLEKGEDGLFRTRDGQPAEPDAAVQVASGSLESSNVNTVAALVRMIELTRKFEAQIKLMQSAEENDSRSAGLLNLNA